MKVKVKKWALRAIFGLVCLAAIEGASQLAYRILKGTWYLRDRNSSARGLNEPHPYFGACFSPNITATRNGITIRHNSFRCRGPEFVRPNPHVQVRIATLGGSTTYCVGVSDGQTWQDYLSKELGARYEVINMAGPGGTSIETMIQSALLFSDVQPDIAMFHLGWNDAQVQHVKDLWPDWSDSHGKFMLSLAANGRELREHTVTGYLIKRMLFHYFFPGMDSDKVLRNLPPDKGAFTDQIDQRAMSHYERNLRLIVSVCRKQGVEPVFVPQILNYRVLTSDKPYGWIPFVRDRDLKTVIAAYNATLEKVAKDEGVLFIGDVLKPDYTESDFIDNGHFSPSGHEKFARALAPKLAALFIGKR